jgi:hypothetical protein
MTYGIIELPEEFRARWENRALAFMDIAEEYLKTGRNDAMSVGIGRDVACQHRKMDWLQYCS